MNRPKPDIHAVLFDADGVVQRMNPTWRTSIERMCGGSEQVDSFINEVFEAEALCLTGDGDFELELRAILKKRNSRATIHEALEVWTMIEPDSAVFDLIRAIRARGTIVALATNQQRHRANHMLSRLAYEAEFDHIFCSCFLGYAKPSAAYFQAALAFLNLPPSNTLFIDDHERNVAAARDVGLHSILFHVDEGAARLEELLHSYRTLPA